jgi:hypothetical protein
MKYDNLVNKLLEDFNVFPQAQGAPSTGPDQGMTQGDKNNTFPSSEVAVKISWPKKKKAKQKKLNHPKETQSKHHR